MLLMIDIGNTNLSFAMMDEKDRIKYTYKVKTKHIYNAASAMRALKQAFLIENTVIASVVPHVCDLMVEACREKFKKEPILVNYLTDTGVTIDIENPETTGADLIADCAAAYDRFKSECLVVDCGTATKFLYVDNDGHFKYGSIAPGLLLSAETLWKYTALLPRVDMYVPNTVLNNETVSCMQSGIMFGYAGMCREIINQFKKEIGHDFPVIVTGGMAYKIFNLVDEMQYYDPNLIFRGMRVVYERIEEDE